MWRILEIYKKLSLTTDQVVNSLLFLLIQAYCSILYLKPRMQIIIQGQKVETQFVTKSLAKVFMDTYKPTGYVSSCK